MHRRLMRARLFAALCLLHPRRRLSRQPRFRAAGDARIRRTLHRLCRQRFRRRHRPAVVGRAGDGDRQGRTRSKSRSAASPTRLDASDRRPQSRPRSTGCTTGCARCRASTTSRARSSALCARHGVDEAAICRELCMSWDELKPFADDPLVTIGAHTITHCNLAKQSRGRPRCTRWRPAARGSKPRCSGPSLHLAYPYGDRIAAGPREFALARAAGFKTAVTTRPGMIFPGKRRPSDRAAAGLAQRQLSGRAHPAGADLGRRDRDVERLSPHRRGVISLHFSPSCGEAARSSARRLERMESTPHPFETLRIAPPLLRGRRRQPLP